MISVWTQIGENGGKMKEKVFSMISVWTQIEENLWKMKEKTIP